MACRSKQGAARGESPKFLAKSDFHAYDFFMITTVTGKNQITIPAKIAAAAAGIQPGTRINWRLGEDGILIGELLPTRTELAHQLAGMGRAWLTPDANPLAELIRERAQADSDEGLEANPV